MQSIDADVETLGTCRHDLEALMTRIRESYLPAAQRLEEVGYPGAEMLRIDLETALEGLGDGTPKLVADQVEMVLYARGDRFLYAWRQEVA